MSALDLISAIWDCAKAIKLPKGWQERGDYSIFKFSSRGAFVFTLHRGQKLQSSIMPSFDIVSQVNSMEIENAVNQAKKELANRFDFKGSNAEIILDKNEIKLTAADAFKVRALNEMVIGRLAKRNISLKSVEQAEPDISPLGHARQSIKIKQGIESTVAKQITGFIRDGKFKVTTQIQGDEVRVNGKSRDELQAVIAAVRGKEFPVSVQFVNFRD
jgi:cyclic-di-GMP-binding protein